jgi:23S rRNA pseudouridine2605 synthase
MTERLQKILSQWGISSRRGAEAMILAGRVRINGSVVQLGQKADPMRDRIEVDGKLIQPANRPELVYLLLHKPAGVVSTCSDPQGRSTILDLLPAKLREGQGIHPVGRLDTDSTGALLLTNDGDLTFRLCHPRHCIPKTYRVWVQGQPSEDILEDWRNGVILDGKKTLPAQVRILKTVAIAIPQSPVKTLLEIVLKEGRNRQIRRIADLLGHPVIQLHRVAIGIIKLQLPGEPPLPPGRYRLLKDFELKFLQTQSS